MLILKTEYNIELVPEHVRAEASLEVAPLDVMVAALTVEVVADAPRRHLKLAFCLHKTVKSSYCLKREIF